MKGRFDVFTDKELLLIESAFSDNGLWSEEQKRRNDLKPAERKTYDTWRDDFIKRHSTYGLQVKKEVSKIE